MFNRKIFVSKDSNLEFSKPATLMPVESPIAMMRGRLRKAFQLFVQIVKFFLDVFAVIGGFYAIYQFYLLSIQPSVEKLEVVVIRRF